MCPPDCAANAATAGNPMPDGGERSFAVKEGKAATSRGGGAHKATSCSLKLPEGAQRRVVHRAWLWTTRWPFVRPRSVLSTTAKHSVVNPCSGRGFCVQAALTPPSKSTEGINRLPCPRGDCPRRWLLDSPNETCSTRGAGRPRRATGCSATLTQPERQFMSVPPCLPTRTVLTQTDGGCP
jgi:hypothetical protein